MCHVMLYNMCHKICHVICVVHVMLNNMCHLNCISFQCNCQNSVLFTLCEKYKTAPIY